MCVFSLVFMHFRLVSHGYDLVKLTKAQHQLSTYTGTTEHEEREASNEDKKKDDAVLVRKLHVFTNVDIFYSFSHCYDLVELPQLNSS